MPHQEVPDWQRRFARRMRSDSTDAEVLLWWAIRKRDLGVRFRRQHPIGPYIVDFVCLSHSLVIEVDGEQHGTPADRRRDHTLEELGFSVLHFWNGEIFTELNAVLDTIVETLEQRSGSTSA